MATGGVLVVVVVFVEGVVLLEVCHQQGVEDSVVVAGDRMPRIGQSCNLVRWSKCKVQELLPGNNCSSPYSSHYKSVD